MNCPNCSKPLTSLKQNDAEAHKCESCKGIFLTETNLKLVAPDLEQYDDSIAQQIAGLPESKLDCPACAVKCRVMKYQDVSLDYCAQCHGIWFDHHELKSITDKAASGAGATPGATPAATFGDTAGDIAGHVVLGLIGGIIAGLFD